MIYFFFSSRRRHTRLTCDWSSDVCSSDLNGSPTNFTGPLWLRNSAFHEVRSNQKNEIRASDLQPGGLLTRHPRLRSRSEERRVGKECRARGTPEAQSNNREGITVNKHS